MASSSAALTIIDRVNDAKQKICVPSSPPLHPACIPEANAKREGAEQDGRGKVCPWKEFLVPKIWHGKDVNSTSRAHGSKHSLPS